MMILTCEGVLINFANVTDLEIVSNTIVAHTVTKDVIPIKTFDKTEDAMGCMRHVMKCLAQGTSLNFSGVDIWADQKDM